MTVHAYITNHRFGFVYPNDVILQKPVMGGVAYQSV